MSQRPQTPELGAMLEREAWVAEVMRLKVKIEKRWGSCTAQSVLNDLLAFAGTRTVELGGLGD